MPVNLRRTLLFASALQVLGPQHDFTLLMQRVLSGSSGDDDDDTFLEEEEEGDTDVAGIVKGGSKEDS